jgi:DNA-binding response OmpR family regulator
MIKILLVEDSKMLRIAGTRALIRAGYEVVAAEDGEQALRFAREKPPDLIVLDMMLPKVNGLDVLRALKSDARTQNAPVIVLSGLSEANREKLINEGAAAFLEKSEKLLANDSAELVDAVKGVLASAAK